MQALVELMHGQQVLTRFMVPYQNLTKCFIEHYLSEHYLMHGGYQISYIDSDGDEITVQFDEDYEVAKLTHEQIMLQLHVELIHQTEVQRWKTLLIHKPEIVPNNQVENNELEKQEETNPISSQPAVIDLLTGDLPSYQLQSEPKVEPKVEPQLLEPLLKQQSSQQKIQPAVDVEPQRTSQKVDVLRPKKVEKPKEKKKKQIISKPDKKKKGLSEKDIKKLVKKQVFKLLPEIAQRIKFQQQAQGDSEPQLMTRLQYERIKDRQQEKSRESILIPKCSTCSAELNIPFYINSSEGVLLCQNCEEKDNTSCPLIKIRSQEMINNLVWAQPICYLNKQGCKEVKGSAKFYQQTKQAIAQMVKAEFDLKIKQAKEEQKREKKEKRQKQIKEKQVKQPKSESMI